MSTQPAPKDIEAKLNDFAESMNDVYSNIRAVKGETFAAAVGASFEARQMVEAVSIIAKEADDSYLIQSMCLALLRLIPSVASRACASLTDAETEEVLAQADLLLRRRNDIAREIRKG